MPVMSGIEATSFLRSHGIDTVIVACTGNALAEDVSAFLNAGANAVLTKPIHKHQLQHTIKLYTASKVKPES